MEGISQRATPEAANQNEGPAEHETFTAEEAAEKIIESIELAQELTAELMEYDRVDMYGQEAVDAINETRVLSAELKSALYYIPAGDCLEKGLPYHPTDEKYQYPATAFPDRPDYPLSYEPKPRPDGSGVGAEYPVAA